MIAPLTAVDWEKVPEEKLSENISRRLVYMDKVMMARLFIRKGTVVPEHHHENEQITWVFKGALEFRIQGKTVIVGENRFILIPSNVPHSAKAIDDTVEVDIFSPVRKDWLEGKDSYLRYT
jgi:Uncharacterized conserved protein, contains double-stranded beta-helix domain